jgi:hypothetical protein
MARNLRQVTGRATFRFPGDVESHYFESSVVRNPRYAGKWVAIKGRRVLTHSNRGEDVFDWLVERDIADALVVEVPQRSRRPRVMFV